MARVVGHLKREIIKDTASDPWHLLICCTRIIIQSLVSEIKHPTLAGKDASEEISNQGNKKAASVGGHAHGDDADDRAEECHRELRPGPGL